MDVSWTIMDDACQQIVRLAPSLDLMMSSGRLSLDSSYRKLIDQRHLRHTARTKIQPRLAWAKLNANWIRGEGCGGEGVKLNKRKKQITIQGRQPLQANPPHPFAKEKYHQLLKSKCLNLWVCFQKYSQIYLLPYQGLTFSKTFKRQQLMLCTEKRLFCTRVQHFVG